MPLRDNNFRKVWWKLQQLVKIGSPILSALEKMPPAATTTKKLRFLTVAPALDSPQLNILQSQTNIIMVSIRLIIIY